MLLYDGGKILVTMAAGSVLGFLYVLLLPVAWIVAAILIIMKRIIVGIAGVTAKSTAFGWRPIEAYLTGKKKKKQTRRSRRDAVKAGEGNTNWKGGIPMLTYRGGYKVQKGTYWDLAKGERIDMNAEGVLPGDRKTIFVKMPVAAVLLAGPVIGLLYAVFLPFIGIAMTLMLVGKKLISGIVHVAVKSTSFGWRPIESYLDGKQRKKREPKETKGHDKS